MHTRVFAAISSLQMIMLGKNKITVLTVVVIFGLQPAFERELCHSFFVVLRNKLHSKKFNSCKAKMKISDFGER